MSDAIRFMGTWRGVTQRYVRVSSVWRKVSGIAVRSGGSWRLAPGSAPSFSASAPTSVSGYAFSNRGAIDVNTTAGITVNGGTGPYRYQWTKLDGDTKISISDPTRAGVTFTARLNGMTAATTYGWTAQDAAGSVASGTTAVQLEVGNNN